MRCYPSITDVSFNTLSSLPSLETNNQIFVNIIRIRFEKIDFNMM